MCEVSLSVLRMKHANAYKQSTVDACYNVPERANLIHDEVILRGRKGDEWVVGLHLAGSADHNVHACGVVWQNLVQRALSNGAESKYVVLANGIEAEVHLANKLSAHAVRSQTEERQKRRGRGAKRWVSRRGRITRRMMREKNGKERKREADNMGGVLDYNAMGILIAACDSSTHHLLLPQACLPLHSRLFLPARIPELQAKTGLGVGNNASDDERNEPAPKRDEGQGHVKE